MLAYAAPAAILAGLAILIGVGIGYKRELKDFIEHFVAVLDTWGPIRFAYIFGQPAMSAVLVSW